MYIVVVLVVKLSHFVKFVKTPIDDSFVYLCLPGLMNRPQLSICLVTM
jgi:hypothetical protein